MHSTRLRCSEDTTAGAAKGSLKWPALKEVESNWIPPSAPQPSPLQASLVIRLVCPSDSEGRCCSEQNAPRTQEGALPTSHALPPLIGPALDVL